MKVLQINADWDQGGPGTVGNDLCNILIEEGHQCIVVYGRKSIVNNAPSFQIDTKAELVAHAFFSRVFGNEGSYSTRATRKLIRIIESEKPDIVQLHNILGHYLNHKMLFSYLKDKKIPTFWTIHDCSPFTGHCINFERVSCLKWENYCEKCPLYKDYPYSFFLDTSKSMFKKKQIMYKEMDNLHLIVPSEWMLDKVKRSFLGQLDVHLLHNGINLDEFKPKSIRKNIEEKYDVRDKKILVAAAYNWNEMKGWNIALQISEILGNEYAFFVIGNKDESAVRGNMISIPVVTNPRELISWYSSADVFINPTLGDNFPTVNIEALSCGTPIVTCDTGGSPEIAGNKYGRIVYSKTAGEFVKKIEECILENYDPNDCHQYAMRFDRKVCYNKYIDLYQKVLRTDDRRL